MKKKKVMIVSSIVVIICLFIGTAVYVQSKASGSPTGAPKNAASVTVEAAHRETMVTTVNANGEVILEEKETIYAESQSKIEDITVEVGDQVTAGQVLVVFDQENLDTLYEQLEEANLVLQSAQLALDASQIPLNEIDTISNEAQIVQSENAITELDNQIAQLDVNISQMETEIAEKYIDFDNQTMLYENGVIAKVELDATQDMLTQMENELETAQIKRDSLISSKESAEENLALSEQAYNETVEKQGTQDSANSNKIAAQEVAVQQAQIRIEQIQKNIDEYESEKVATIDGTVTAITAVEGSFASPTVPIMEIAEISNANQVLQLEIVENKAADIEVGQDAVISGDALGDTTYPGVVEKILPTAEERQIGTNMETVILVNVRATGEDMHVKPGNTLTADITTSISENALVIPLVATFTDENKDDFVYVMKDDYSVEKRIVELGSYSGLYIEATGVTEGEYIVLDPPKTIKEGDFVSPKNLADMQTKPDEAPVKTE